jgi:hypothetical protein
MDYKMLKHNDLPEAGAPVCKSGLQDAHGSQNGHTAEPDSERVPSGSDRNERGRFTLGNRAAQRARVAPERFEAIRGQLATRYSSSPLPAPVRDPLISELAHTCTAAEVLLEPMARFGLVSERGRRRPAYLAYLGLMERAEQILSLLEPKRSGKRRVDPQAAMAELRALAERKG